jgi:hypothetical protein
MIKKITYNCNNMTNDEIMLITGVASSIGVILGAWFLVVKFISPLLKRIHGWVDTWEKFMRDWAGTPSEPGRDAVPGVMQRLNDIDGELKHNGGSSMKDQLSRLESELEKAELSRRETSIKVDEIYKIVKSKSRSKN